MFKLKCTVFFLLLIVSGFASAQNVASSEGIIQKPKHSPHKASIYSAILPGLGQAYNKKYWKIPIVYAGIGTITYFAITNRKEYILAKDAYNYVSNEEDFPIDNKYVGRYSAADLVQIRDYYRRNTELSWILLGVWYILNIVDATVDAHFFDYDISGNLSLQLQPSAAPQGTFLLPENSLNNQTLVTLRYHF
ncbi:MAG: hypothetical protein CVT92_01240 [Bacteroidetes bacterium HGW-Bacteroidetes-1]|jgi:hypothetical protein|nr:MAG: hypothetical protein CVT92_01240 [Bacteroidetes bacterium HGW-Bacteroidetes-1]